VTNEGLRALVQLAGSDPSLLDEVVAAARARSPEVAALPEHEVRRHTQAVLEAATAALLRGEPDKDELATAEQLGTDRAVQGVPVAALLDGFQAARSWLLRSIVERGRGAGMAADDLLDVVSRIDAITTALEHRMVHAHRITELELARTTRENDAQRLRALLRGEPVDRPLEPGRDYRCVVTDISDPAAARPIETMLAAAGLTGMVDGRLAAVLHRLPVFPNPRRLPPLVVSPPVPPAQLPAMYEVCRRALQTATADGGPQDLTSLALPTAVHAQPELGRLLAAQLLPALDPTDPFHRELARTAIAYLDHGAHIDLTAAALHVHPNTVKYRIRRLQDLTTHQLTGPLLYCAHLWWALQVWLKTAT
jgi:DNA-binding PucR family transcriptional regulator